MFCSYSERRLLRSFPPSLSSVPHLLTPSPPLPLGPVWTPLQTSIAFDDARSVLFAGHNDGSIFVRKLERTPSGALGVKILRFCDPAKTATTPSRITCMSFDSLLDRLYTGDMSGLSRIVKKVSGVPYETTEVGTRAVSDGTFRARRGSLATGEDAI